MSSAETGEARRYEPDPPVAPEIIYHVVTQLDEPQVKTWIVFPSVAFLICFMLFCLFRRFRGHKNLSVGHPKLEKFIPPDDSVMDPKKKE
jgi:hypothetical protein